MRTARQLRRAVAVLAVVLATAAMIAPPAPASILDRACAVAGKVDTVLHNACGAARVDRRVVAAGAHVVSGHPAAAVTSLASAAASPVASAVFDLGLGAVVSWATGGAKAALDETGKLVDATTSPQLGTPWFSRVYWRVAGLALLLTLPFLCAAAVQALIRSDLSLLARAAFGYLPLAMLLVGIAAQLTALLLSATDAMSGVVADAAGRDAGAFLGRAGTVVASLSVITQSPFLAFLLAVFTVAGALALWTELVMRDAAVYVIVTMLPLAFAAMVWPARRVWALRAVEVLAALILAKLVIVIVLTLGGAALENSTVVGFMMGPVLLALALFAPWAMVRLLPMAELASGAAGRLSADLGGTRAQGALPLTLANAAHGWASATTAQMRRDAGEASEPPLGEPPPELDGGGGERPPDGPLPEPRATTPLDPDGHVPDAEAAPGDGTDAAEIPSAADGLGADSAAAAEPLEPVGPLAGDDNPGWLGLPDDHTAPPRPDAGAGSFADGLPVDGPPPSGEHLSWELPLGPGERPDVPWPGADRLADLDRPGDEAAPTPDDSGAPPPSEDGQP